MITAIITARGLHTTTSTDGSVDADILEDGALVGECTLCPDHAMELAVWGDNGHWANDELHAFLDRDEFSDDYNRSANVGLVVAAVRRVA